MLWDFLVHRRVDKGVPIWDDFRKPQHDVQRC